MCSIGEHVGGSCQPPFDKKEDFTAEQWKLLKLRSGKQAIRTVCNLHKSKFLSLYESRQKVCCNPFPNGHTNGPGKGSKPITLSLYRKAKGTLALVPGKKLCISCYKSALDLVGAEDEVESADATPENSQEAVEGQGAAKGLEADTALIARQDQGSAKGVEVDTALIARQDQGSAKGVEVDTALIAKQDQGTAKGSEADAALTTKQDQGIEVRDGQVTGFPAGMMCSPSVSSRLRQRVVRAVSTNSSPSSTGTNNATTSATSSPGFVPPDEVLDLLNAVLPKLGCQVVDKETLKARNWYGTEKLQEVTSSVKKFFQDIAPNYEIKELHEENSIDFLQVLKLLKEKFQLSATISDKVLVLSVLPPSWSIGRIQEEFGPNATQYVIRLTKTLVEKNGVLVTPDKKQGRPISDNTVQKVIQFYELDEISSKLMPGCKDYVSVVENGQRVQKQKRLLLSNLDSLYEEYKQRHGTENPLSFSKFAKLRPKHCVLAGAPGTHAVCVCIYHETANLMFEGAHFKEASANSEIPLNNFKDCLNQLVCPEKLPSCYLRQCKNCPSGEPLKARLKDLLNASLVTSVAYRNWFKDTGRYRLEKVIKPVDEFLDNFMQVLFKLLPHHFITKEQSAHYQKIKEELQEGEALIICDFAENFSCVMQNEVQGYHWTNEQVTIHPFVAYYKDVTGTVKVVSYASVTDNKKHLTATFHSFQKKFVPFLKKTMADDGVTCQKMYYFSDGSSAQYKNRKNIVNICLHEADYDIQIEWHFFASCHGKGPCDGVGGTLKRYAARASLQGTIIRNAKEFCEWAESLPNITAELVTMDETEDALISQEERSKDVLVINGIATYHAAIPESECSVRLKRYSNATDFIPMPLYKRRFLVPWDSIVNLHYVIVAQHDNWCLAQVVNKIEDTKEIQLKFMTPPGRQRAYNWPLINDEATLHWRYVLTTTEPVQKRVFTIPVKDKNRADRELKLYTEMNGVGLPPLDDEDPDDPDD